MNGPDTTRTSSPIRSLAPLNSLAMLAYPREKSGNVGRVGICLDFVCNWLTEKSASGTFLWVGIFLDRFR